MANTSSLPKWVTSARQTHLVALFERSGGFCVFGHKECLIPEHHYEVFIGDLIADWVSDDKAQKLAEWLTERKELHSFGQHTYPLRGQFSAISKEIFGENQPLYYIQGLGMSGVTLKPFAKVRISSSYFTLFIALGDALRPVSKSKRRKAIRYGKPLPKDTQTTISEIVNEAVKHYIAH